MNIGSLIDGDTFWAIKTGEWISAHGIPHADPFSWTVLGQPWVAHEWLFDFLIYKFYWAFGYYGIALFILIGLFLLIYFLWKLYSSENKNVFQAVILMIIVVFMLKPGIVARPQVFGYAFFVYFFYVLYNKRDLLWTLPFVTVLWANMHGSVVLGIAMVFLQFVYDSVYESVAQKKFALNSKLLVVSLFVPLFSLLNPYGTKLWSASYLLITNDMNMQIVEWQPPDFGDPLWLFIYLTIIFVAVIISFYGKHAGYNYRFNLLAVYLAGTFYKAITGLRYLPYLAICWGLFVLKMMPDHLFSDNKLFNKKLSGIIALVMFVFIAFSISSLPVSLEDAVDKKAWPVDAASRLENKITYNDYRWGGYLIFKDIPVFIDSRADIYWKDSDVFKDDLDMGRFKRDPLDILNKYGIEQVIIPGGDPLDIFLKRVGWVEYYRDETAVIYLRHELP
jgi:hypothetical protein